MSLSSGTRIGAYEVVGSLGAGGMGEVYRARDTRLGRDVALKLLPEAFALDSERLARFQREAQVLAALSHPNIAAIFGVEDGPAAGGAQTALVMELVDGETLADRIARGPVPVDEALPIARQIADALAAAHDKGIVHRDVKPANVKVRPDGTVKVLDFGLAKLSDLNAPAQDVAGFSLSPTITSPAVTGAGVILGTAAYMSPEQAKGRPVDKRSDVWSFGAVLYEMLTGRRAFEADDVSETLAAILRSEPAWNALPDATPAAVIALLQACLAKDTRSRVADLSTAVFVIERLPTPDRPTAKRTYRTSALAAVAAAAVAVLVPANLVHWREQRPPADPIEFHIVAPDETVGNVAAMSRDGTAVAFINAGGRTGRLWVRRLESGQSKLVVDGSAPVNGPFWSADGGSVAYISAGKLYRASPNGGRVEAVGSVPDQFRGAAWGASMIVFGTTNGLYRMRPGDGATEQISSLDPKRAELAHRSPSFLPDGRRFVYMRLGTTPVQSGIYLGAVDTASSEWPAEPIVTNLVAGPVYVEDEGTPTAGRRGYLLYVRDTDLFAQPFDTESERLAGEPVLLAANVQAGGNFNSFSGSLNGRLVYRRNTQATERLRWLGRSGTPIGAATDNVRYEEPALSPDGRRLAATQRGTSGSRDIRLLDLERGVGMAFVSTAEDERSPVWSPEGRSLVYSARRGGSADLYMKAAAGIEAEELLFRSDEMKTPNDWSRDGRYLLFTSVSQKTGADLWALRMQKPREARVVARTSASDGQGQFSPDGSLVAYTSADEGIAQVYLQTFPESAQRWKVSNASGVEPRWRADGAELFFREIGGGLVSVSVTRTPAIKLGVPQPVFNGNIAGAGGISFNPQWLPRDGNRFLALTPDGEDTLPSLTVLINWASHLDARRTAR